MDMRKAIRLIENLSAGKWWFDSTTNSLLPVKKEFHLDEILDNPKIFYIDPQWIEKIKIEDEDWTDSVILKAIHNGWVRIGVDAADGREIPYITVYNKEIAKKTIRLLLNKNWLPDDKLDIEIAPDHGWIGDGEFIQLTNALQIKQFLSTGTVRPNSNFRESVNSFTVQIIDGPSLQEWRSKLPNKVIKTLNDELHYFEVSQCKSDETHITVWDGKKLIGDLELQINPYNKKEVWLKHVSTRKGYQNMGIASIMLKNAMMFCENNSLILALSSFSDDGEKYLPNILKKLEKEFPKVKMVYPRY